MARKLLTFAALAAASAVAPMQLAHAEWTKGYVIEWIEQASYYGAKAGVIDPGTDCPKGTNPEPNWVKMLVKAGYTQEQAEWIPNRATRGPAPPPATPKMPSRGKTSASV